MVDGGKIVVRLEEHIVLKRLQLKRFVESLYPAFAFEGYAAVLKEVGGEHVHGRYC